MPRLLANPYIPHTELWWKSLDDQCIGDVPRELVEMAVTESADVQPDRVAIVMEYARALKGWVEEEPSFTVIED